jgi:hypothetical protein
MVSRQYYLTTLASWRGRAHRFAESHFVVANVSADAGVHDDTPVLALITADEATHTALESHADFEALPHPLARKPVSQRVAARLAPFGVTPGDDTFAVAEKLAHVHPLLRCRAF